MFDKSSPLFWAIMLPAHVSVYSFRIRKAYISCYFVFIITCAGEFTHKSRAPGRGEWIEVAKKEKRDFLLYALNRDRCYLISPGFPRNTLNQSPKPGWAPFIEMLFYWIEIKYLTKHIRRSHTRNESHEDAFFHWIPSHSTLLELLPTSSSLKWNADRYLGYPPPLLPIKKKFFLDQ